MSIPSSARTASSNRWFSRNWTAKKSAEEENKVENNKTWSSKSREQVKNLQHKKQEKQRFAPEFDGLHCFETIVSS